MITKSTSGRASPTCVETTVPLTRVAFVSGQATEFEKQVWNFTLVALPHFLKPLGQVPEEEIIGLSNFEELGKRFTQRI